MFADTLSWAVRRGIPLSEAMNSLPFFRNSGLARSTILFALGWFLKPLFFLVPVPWFIDIHWSRYIRRALADLAKGEKLSVALHRHLYRYFPDFYFLAIGKAETEGRLVEALPLLARQLNFPSQVASERKSALFIVGIKLLVAANVIGFLLVYVVPRFEMIIYDLTGRSDGPAGFLPLVYVTSFIQFTIPVLILLHVVVPRMGVAGEYLLLNLPLTGRDLKRLYVGEAARSMAVFVRQGETLVSAAEWSLKASRSRWMKKRLQRFLNRLRTGEQWDEAWRAVHKGPPLNQWAIKNAASREDPAGGFELLGEWLHSAVDSSTRKIELWVDPVCTLALGAVVWQVAYYVFSSIIRCEYALM
jgi:type II secretory pathway component PulF